MSEWKDPIAGDVARKGGDVEKKSQESNFQVEVVEATSESAKPLKNQKNLEITDEMLSERAQKRISTVTRKFKESEEARTRDVQMLQNELVKMRTALEATQRQGNQNAIASHGAVEKQIKDKQKLAETALKQAHETGDTTKVVEATLALADAQSELKLLQYTRPQEQAPAQKREEKPLQQTQANQKPEYDPKAVEWADSKPWFNKNRVLTAAAFAINEDLLQEGFDPSEQEFYQELDNRLASEFPAKLGKQEEQEEQPRKRPQGNSPVAGVSRTQGGKSTYQITRQQADKAKKFWGISPEEFARQQKMIDDAGDDYVTIV